MNKNSLFVIGRNIYQAACGSANEATRFVRDFMTSTRGFELEKRKAILDGMLFEMFFDADGMLRKSIKGQFFDELFDLQRHRDLKGSFDFIAEALIAAGGNFFAVPGKGHDLAVTVSTNWSLHYRAPTSTRRANILDGRWPRPCDLDHTPTRLEERQNGATQ
jgi:hypothetical protein